MKQNLRRAVNLTALVLAAGLLIGLTGCFQLGSSKPQPNGPVQPTAPSLFKTNGHGIITGYNCGKEDLPKALVIPAKIGNEVITGIRNDAFYKCEGLTSLDLSACTSLTVISVETIGSHMGAFFGCTGLTEVKLPASLTKIGWYAFCGCGLTSIDLSACRSLTEIAYNAFSVCTGLTSIDLSACTSLTEIGKLAFSGCTGLTEVKLPASLTKISQGAFEGCTGLTSIDLSGCTSLTEINGFSGCTSLTEVKMPANLSEIGKGAFFGCTGLTSIDLSGCTSLTKIDSYAFSGCTGLTEVKLPASLSEIGKEAFKGCTGLTSAVFADKHNWKADETPIASTSLENAATAALYLRETYVDKYWKKN